MYTIGPINYDPPEYNAALPYHRPVEVPVVKYVMLEVPINRREKIAQNKLSGGKKKDAGIERLELSTFCL